MKQVGANVSATYAGRRGTMKGDGEAAYLETPFQKTSEGNKVQASCDEQSGGEWYSRGQGKKGLEQVRHDLEQPKQSKPRVSAGTLSV